MKKTTLITLLKSLNRQKGFTLLNFLILAASMVVIMIVTSLYHMFQVSESNNLPTENMWVVKEMKNNFHSINLEAESFKLLTKCFSEEELACISLSHTQSMVLGHKEQEFEYREINRLFSQLFDFDFIAGGNFREKHFDGNRRIVIVSEKIAKLVYGRTDVIGEDFLLYRAKYKIVGVYKNIVRANQFYADVYMPWDSEDIIASILPTVFIHPKKESSSEILQQQIEKHAAEGKLRVFPISQLIDREWQLLELPLFIGFLLALLLPMLILTNITLYRMQIRAVEMGIRKAFGAPRKSIYVQLLSENVLFTLLAGIQAYAIGQYFVGTLFYGYTTDFWTFSLPTVVAFQVFGAFLLFGIVTSIIPARKVAHQQIVQSLNSN